MLQMYGKVQRNDYNTCIPDPVNERRLRKLEHVFHNLQALYDTNILDSNIEIREDNGGFNIVLKSKPEVSIGRVYPDESRADFFVYSPALNRDYFIPFLRNAFQFFIAGAGEFILHASAIVENDEGMIFTGASGAGKTTISNFYPKDAVLSDEFICLRNSGNT